MSLKEKMEAISPLAVSPAIKSCMSGSASLTELQLQQLKWRKSLPTKKQLRHFMRGQRNTDDNHEIDSYNQGPRIKCYSDKIMEAGTSAWEMFFGNVLDQLSTASLLDVATLESIAADVDAKVESLQECVANSSSGIKIVAPKLQEVDSGTEVSHCESDVLALNCFLTNVVQALRCHQGFEDSIMKELLMFCSRNGFLLPPVASEIEHHAMGSSASLNTVSVADEETKLELWNKIKSKVKGGIVHKLQQCNVLTRHKYELPGYQKEIMRRVQLIDLLMALLPVNDILDLYARTRRSKLEQFLAGAKKYSVSWADETDIEKVKLLENLEVFVVTQLDMLNMDVSVLWKINEYLPKFSITDFVERVYFPQLSSTLDKLIRCFECDSVSQASNLLLAVENVGKREKLTSIDDIRFIAKAFAILCNWESEVKEIVSYFSVKPERRFSGNGLRSVLKSTPNVSPSSSKAEGLDGIIWDEENDNMKNSIQDKWPWRESFKCLIPDLRKAVINNLCPSVALADIIEHDKESDMICVNEKLFHDDPKYPQKLPRSYAKLASLFDEALVLASSLGGALFEPVQNAFIECVSSNLRETHKLLIEIVQSFPENPDVTSLYTVICTAAFFQQHLHFYEENTENLRKKPFQHLIQLMSELLENAKSTVILYHLKIITTSLIFDAQSNNWNDNKPFFEGERYSYCIQAWSYYVNCIYNDIWTTLPRTESEEILNVVVSKSLVLLTGRYSKLRPSFARTKQLSCDVSAICDVTSWLCWNLASSYTDILCREVGVSPKHNWHPLCSNMLVNMILVCAPLKMVADYLTNAPNAENSDQTIIEPPKLLFLWSEPCVFPKPVNSLSEMDEREAVLVIFKLIVSHSYPKWQLVCQAMLMRNALLPTLIASYADIFTQTSISVPMSDANNPLNSNFLVSKTIESSNLDLKAFFSHVYLLLFKASSKSDALAHFLMALANRENTWGLFDNHIVMRAKATHETPVWLLNVEKSLIPFLSRSFLPALEMICDADRKKSQPSFAFTNLEMLPCGCATVAKDSSSFFSSEGELLYQCLVSTLNVLMENLNTIPRIIAVFFNRLNEYLYQRHFSAATKSPGLKILAFISYKWLTTHENIVLLFDFVVSDDTMGRIKCFAELFWHLLFNLTTDVSQNPSIPSDILSHIKSNKSWLQDKLKMLTNYFKASSVVHSSANNIEQLTDEVAESQYLSLASTLMSLPECRDALKIFYDILKANQEKIEEKLLSSRGAAPGKRICVRNTSDGSCSPNPLKEYQRFGEYLHDQEMMTEVPIDWSKWISVADKFPVDVVRRIVLSRQEFLAESYSYLTEEESIAHEKLLRYFENNSSSIVDRPLSSTSSSTRSSSVTD